MIENYEGRQLGLLHATHRTAVMAKTFTDRIFPGMVCRHIVDELIAKDNFDSEIGVLPKKNFLKYAFYSKMLEEAGCEAIVSCCTFMTEALEYAQKVVGIPCFSLEDPVIKQAAHYDRVGLVYTTEYLLPYTKRALYNEAARIGRKVELIDVLDKNIYQYFYLEEFDKHNQMMIEQMRKLEEKVDCLILAQGPHSIMEDDVKDAGFKIPVFCPGTATFNMVKEEINKRYFAK